MEWVRFLAHAFAFSPQIRQERGGRPRTERLKGTESGPRTSMSKSRPSPWFSSMEVIFLFISGASASRRKKASGPVFSLDSSKERRSWPETAARISRRPFSKARMAMGKHLISPGIFKEKLMRQRAPGVFKRIFCFPARRLRASRISVRDAGEPQKIWFNFMGALQIRFSDTGPYTAAQAVRPPP